MTSKKWVASVLVVLVGSPFAVAALDAIGIGPYWQVEAPEWEAGYSWTYANSMDFQMEARSGEWGDESGSYRMAGESKLTVVNTTAMIHEIPLYAVVEQWVPQKVVEDGETIYESDDGVGDVNGSHESGMGMESEGVFVSSDVCMFECGSTNSYYTRDNINPYYEDWGWDSGNELKLLEFPLKHGASWTVYRNEETGMGPGHTLVEEVTARVAGRDVVNLPKVGGMEAVRIEATLSGESKESMESFAAKIPGMSMEVDVDYRLTYWYAPETKSIVRFDMDRLEEVSLEFEGQRMSFKGEYRMRDVLTDYSLEAMPERSLEESNKLRDLLEDLPDVKELSDENWPFTLAASSLSAMASSEDTRSQGETVVLGIREGEQARPLESTRFDGLPEGMKLKWRHRYLEPVEGEEWPSVVTREDWYTGADLELTLNAGVHQVVAYLLDDKDRLVDLDSVLLEGYTRVDMESSFPVGLAQTGEVSHGFTSNLFLKEIWMSARAGEVGAGQMFVYDYEERRYVEMQPVESTSGWQDMGYEAEHPDRPKAYRVGYRDYARAGDAALIVEVHYDREIEDATFEEYWQIYDQSLRVHREVSTAGGPVCTISSALCMLEELGSGGSPQDLRDSLASRLGLTG